MNEICCKYCKEPILKHETIYTVKGGYVHDECMENYVEDIWFELNLVNRMQLLDIDTGLTTLSEEEGSI